MKTGYKLNDIDEMDIYYYFKLLNYTSKKKQLAAEKVFDAMGI